MNIIDNNFYKLSNEIKRLSEKEIYYRIRSKLNNVPIETIKNCEKFFNQFGYWGKLDIEHDIYEEIELKSFELYNHIDDFIWLYEKLEDYRSKKTLYSILNNWYNYDFKNTSEAREIMYDDYFDLDIVKCNNEIIVDLGAYTGDTILSYIKNYGEDSYEKIYCYEITDDSYEKLKYNLKDFHNIIFRKKGISDKCGMMDLLNNEHDSANKLTYSENGNIEVTTLDSDIKDKITLIKSDIEGFEQNMIKGSINHIKNDHPKLLISVYHTNEDLWKIPKMIYDIDSSYRFYLRYNSSPIYPTEITLIAI